MPINNALQNFFDGFFKLLFGIVGFIVWEIFSNGRWKEERTKPNPALFWQNQALAARRQFRDLDYKTRRQIEELEEALRKEKSKKR